jgi:hypothetical protein
MTARDLTLALRGRWHGNSGKVRCPCHDDRTPSMSVRDGDEPGRILVHCFAGCQSEDIINELRRPRPLHPSPNTSINPCAVTISRELALSFDTSGPGLDISPTVTPPTNCNSCDRRWRK